MSSRSIFRGCVAAVAVLSFSGATNPAAAQVAAPVGPSVEQIRLLAEEAYVFAYPMLENYKTADTLTLRPDAPSWTMPINALYRGQTLATANDRTDARTSNDTLYVFAWADLRAEPLVLSVPAIADKRYYGFQLVDMYTYNYGYVGTRATGSAAGNYLIAGPGWKGATPRGINKVYKSEGNLVFLLGRVLVNGPNDLPAAQAVENQMQLRPLSAFLGQPAPPATPALAYPPYDAEKAASADFIGYMNFLLTLLDIYPSEKAMIDNWKAIGVEPGKPFDASKIDPTTRAAIDAGVAWAIAKIDAAAENLDVLRNGWQLIDDTFGNREMMRGRYLTRAAAAKFGIYSNDAAEALYPSTYVGPDGQPLDGSKHRYVIRFGKDALPPVDAFWSITMYDMPAQFMVANPIDRYSIGDRTQGLERGKDGSLTLYLQAAKPTDPTQAANWLPAPNGLFTLTMRLYMPKPSALKPLYAPPPVEIADEASK